MKGIFVSTNIKGKCLSFVGTNELENGMLLEKGDLVTGETQVYNTALPTGDNTVYVAGDPAWSYDTSTVINQNENEYVIPAGKQFRVYPLEAGDRFTVADYGITGGDTVAVGDYVGLTNGSALPTATGATEPTTAFVGKVVNVVTKGFTYWVGQQVDNSVRLVTIEVVKNG